MRQFARSPGELEQLLSQRPDCPAGSPRECHGQPHFSAGRGKRERGAVALRSRFSDSGSIDAASAGLQRRAPFMTPFWPGARERSAGKGSPFSSGRTAIRIGCRPFRSNSSAPSTSTPRHAWAAARIASRWEAGGLSSIHERGRKRGGNTALANGLVLTSATFISSRRTIGKPADALVSLSDAMVCR